MPSCGACALFCTVLSPLPCCFTLVELVRSPCAVLSPLPCCFSLVELVRSPALCLVRTAFAMRGYLERRSPLFGALKALKTLRVLKNHRFSNTPNISNTSNTPKIHPLAARMIDFTDISLSSFSLNVRCFSRGFFFVVLSAVCLCFCFLFPCFFIFALVELALCRLSLHVRACDCFRE